jgi:hypothetical protein
MMARLGLRAAGTAVKKYTKTGMGSGLKTIGMLRFSDIAGCRWACAALAERKDG